MAEAYAPLAVVTQISPSTVYEGQLINVSLLGANLEVVTDVQFGSGVVAKIASKSDTEIVVTLTVGRVKDQRRRPVTLVTPTGPQPGTTAIQFEPAPTKVEMFPDDLVMSPYPAGEVFLFRATALSGPIAISDICVRFALNDQPLTSCSETDGNGEATFELLRPGEPGKGRVWTLKAVADIERNGSISGNPVGLVEVRWQAVRE